MKRLYRRMRRLYIRARRCRIAAEGIKSADIGYLTIKHSFNNHALVLEHKALKIARKIYKRESIKKTNKG